MSRFRISDFGLRISSKSVPTLCRASCKKRGSPGKGWGTRPVSDLQSAIRNPQPVPAQSGSAIAGVTLLEMLVVLAIIAIAGAVVFPSITSGLETVRLRTTAERLGSTFRFARETALYRQAICQVTVDPERQMVSLEEINPRQPAASRLRNWELPPEVRADIPRAGVYIFAPDGGGPEIRLVLRNSRGRTALVELDVLTGLPKVTMP